MKTVRLVFSSRFGLWDLRQLFRPSVVQPHFYKRFLICHCSDSLIALTETAYEARVGSAGCLNKAIKTHARTA